MLVDGSGELVLLDWDDAGPASPGRELAYLLVAWHVHDGKPNAAAVRSTLAAYQAVGAKFVAKEFFERERVDFVPLLTRVRPV